MKFFFKCFLSLSLNCYTLNELQCCIKVVFATFTHHLPTERLNVGVLVALRGQTYRAYSTLNCVASL